MGSQRIHMKETKRRNMQLERGIGTAQLNGYQHVNQLDWNMA